MSHYAIVAIHWLVKALAGKHKRRHHNERLLLVAVLDVTGHEIATDYFPVIPCVLHYRWPSQYVLNDDLLMISFISNKYIEEEDYT